MASSSPSLPAAYPWQLADDLRYTHSLSLPLTAEYVVMCIYKALMKGYVASISTAKLKIEEFYNFYDMQHLSWIQVCLLVYYLLLLVHYLLDH